MKNLTLILAIFTFLISCTKPKNNQNIEVKTITDTITISVKDTIYKTLEKEINSEPYFFWDRLPNWFLKSNLLDKSIFNKNYSISSSINPFYLEEDFNGDSIIDLFICISHIKSGKKGFAIIHGSTNEVHIIGANSKIKHSSYDDFHYVDIIKLNREKTNFPGLEENTGTGPKGELIITNPSIKIEKSELGGGIIYWNGDEYAYFHQTC